MPVQLSRVRKFVPEGANKERDDAEKIAVYLRTVDVYTKQLHIRKFLDKTPKELTAAMMSEQGSKEILGILTKCVVKFENLEYIPEAASKNGEMGEPRTATIQDVWDAGEFPLCLEIFSNILNSSQLQKDEEKNSDSQSGSSPTQETEQVH
jgi:hypothetical protein